MDKYSNNQSFPYLRFPAGVGLCLDDEHHCVVVVNVLQSSSSFSAGIKSGDVLLAVDGVNVANLTAEKVASSMIIGDPGSTITIEVLRTGHPGPLTFCMLRKPLDSLQLFQSNDSGRAVNGIDPHESIETSIIDAETPVAQQDKSCSYQAHDRLNVHQNQLREYLTKWSNHCLPNKYCHIFGKYTFKVIPHRFLLKHFSAWAAVSCRPLASHRGRSGSLGSMRLSGSDLALHQNEAHGSTRGCDDETAAIRTAQPEAKLTPTCSLTPSFQTTSAIRGCLAKSAAGGAVQDTDTELPIFSATLHALVKRRLFRRRLSCAVAQWTSAVHCARILADEAYFAVRGRRAAQAVFSALRAWADLCQSVRVLLRSCLHRAAIRFATAHLAAWNKLALRRAALRAAVDCCRQRAQLDSFHGFLAAWRGLNTAVLAVASATAGRRQMADMRFAYAVWSGRDYTAESGAGCRQVADSAVAKRCLQRMSGLVRLMTGQAECASEWVVTVLSAWFAASVARRMACAIATRVQKRNAVQALLELRCFAARRRFLRTSAAGVGDASRRRSKAVTLTKWYKSACDSAAIARCVSLCLLVRRRRRLAASFAAAAHRMTYLRFLHTAEAGARILGLAARLSRVLDAWSGQASDSRQLRETEICCGGWWRAWALRNALRALSRHFNRRRRLLAAAGDHLMRLAAPRTGFKVADQARCDVLDYGEGLAGRVRRGLRLRRCRVAWIGLEVCTARTRRQRVATDRVWAGRLSRLLLGSFLILRKYAEQRLRMRSLATLADKLYCQRRKAVAMRGWGSWFLLRRRRAAIFETQAKKLLLARWVRWKQASRGALNVRVRMLKGVDLAKQLLRARTLSCRRICVLWVEWSLKKRYLNGAASLIFARRNSSVMCHAFCEWQQWFRNCKQKGVLIFRFQYARDTALKSLSLNCIKRLHLNARICKTAVQSGFVRVQLRAFSNWLGSTKLSVNEKCICILSNSHFHVDTPASVCRDFLRLARGNTSVAQSMLREWNLSRLRALLDGYDLKCTEYVLEKIVHRHESKYFERLKDAVQPCKIQVLSVRCSYGSFFQEWLRYVLFRRNLSERILVIAVRREFEMRKVSWKFWITFLVASRHLWSCTRQMQEKSNHVLLLTKFHLWRDVIRWGLINLIKKASYFEKIHLIAVQRIFCDWMNLVRQIRCSVYLRELMSKSSCLGLSESSFISWIKVVKTARSLQMEKYNRAKLHLSTLDCWYISKTRKVVHMSVWSERLKLLNQLRKIAKTKRESLVNIAFQGWHHSRKTSRHRKALVLQGRIKNLLMLCHKVLQLWALESQYVDVEPRLCKVLALLELRIRGSAQIMTEFVPLWYDATSMRICSRNSRKLQHIKLKKLVLKKMFGVVCGIKVWVQLKKIAELFCRDHVLFKAFCVLKDLSSEQHLTLMSQSSMKTANDRCRSRSLFLWHHSLVGKNEQAINCSIFLLSGKYFRFWWHRLKISRKDSGMKISAILRCTAFYVQCNAVSVSSILTCWQSWASDKTELETTKRIMAKLDVNRARRAFLKWIKRFQIKKAIPVLKDQIMNHMNFAKLMRYFRYWNSVVLFGQIVVGMRTGKSLWQQPGPSVAFLFCFRIEVIFANQQSRCLDLCFISWLRAKHLSRIYRDRLNTMTLEFKAKSFLAWKMSIKRYESKILPFSPVCACSSPENDDQFLQLTVQKRVLSSVLSGDGFARLVSCIAELAAESKFGDGRSSVVLDQTKSIANVSGAVCTSSKDGPRTRTHFIDWKTASVRSRFLRYSGKISATKFCSKLLSLVFSKYSAVCQQQGSDAKLCLMRAAKLSRVACEQSTFSFQLFPAWKHYIFLCKEYIKEKLFQLLSKLSLTIGRRDLRATSQAWSAWFDYKSKLKCFAGKLSSFERTCKIDWALSGWLNLQCAKIKIRALEVSLKGRIRKAVVLQHLMRWKAMAVICKREKIWYTYWTTKLAGHYFSSWHINLSKYFDDSSLTTLSRTAPAPKHSDICLPPPKQLHLENQLSNSESHYFYRELKQINELANVTGKMPQANTTVQNRPVLSLKISQNVVEQTLSHAFERTSKALDHVQIPCLPTVGDDDTETSKRKRAAEKRAAFLENMYGPTKRKILMQLQFKKRGNLDQPTSPNAQPQNLLLCNEHQQLVMTPISGSLSCFDDETHDDAFAQLILVENLRFCEEIHFLVWQRSTAVRRKAKMLLNRIQGAVKYKILVGWVQHHSSKVLLLISQMHYCRRLMSKSFEQWIFIPCLGK